MREAVDNSMARGMAIIAVFACLYVAIQSLSAAIPPAPRFPKPRCGDYVEVIDGRRARLACTDEPLLQSCGALEPASRITFAAAPGTCRAVRLAMRPAWQLLAGYKLDINRVKPADLQLIGGIGPHLAGKIAADRELHGAYASLADLQRVRGIGRKTVERLAPYLTARP